MHKHEHAGLRRSASPLRTPFKRLGQTLRLPVSGLNSRQRGGAGGAGARSGGRESRTLLSRLAAGLPQQWAALGYHRLAEPGASNGDLEAATVTPVSSCNSTNITEPSGGKQGRPRSASLRPGATPMRPDFGPMRTRNSFISGLISGNRDPSEESKRMSRATHVASKETRRAPPPDMHVHILCVLTFVHHVTRNTYPLIMPFVVRETLHLPGTMVGVEDSLFALFHMSAVMVLPVVIPYITFRNIMLLFQVLRVASCALHLLMASKLRGSPFGVFYLLASRSLMGISETIYSVSLIWTAQRVSTSKRSRALAALQAFTMIGTFSGSVSIAFLERYATTPVERDSLPALVTLASTILVTVPCLLLFEKEPYVDGTKSGSVKSNQARKTQGGMPAFVYLLCVANFCLMGGVFASMSTIVPMHLRKAYHLAPNDMSSFYSTLSVAMVASSLISMRVRPLSPLPSRLPSLGLPLCYIPLSACHTLT